MDVSASVSMFLPSPARHSGPITFVFPLLRQSLNIHFDAFNIDMSMRKKKPAPEEVSVLDNVPSALKTQIIERILINSSVHELYQGKTE